jgi:hypothetical protein
LGRPAARLSLINVGKSMHLKVDVARHTTDQDELDMTSHEQRQESVEPGGHRLFATRER